MTELKRTGGCLCGSVRFEVTLSAPSVDACHCRMCIKHTSGPLLAADTQSDLVFESDDTLTVYESSGWAERGFCSVCGTGIFWRLKNGAHTSINAGALDDLAGLTLGKEIFIDEKPDLYDFAGERKRMTGEEVVAMFLSGQEPNS